MKTRLIWVKLLVGQGADVTAKNDQGDTPKDLALQNDFYECADVLLELAGVGNFLIHMKLSSSLGSFSFPLK